MKSTKNSNVFLNRSEFFFVIRRNSAIYQFRKYLYRLLHLSQPEIFFLNWIFALVNENNIALMDSDISEKEIKANKLHINQLIKIENPKSFLGRRIDQFNQIFSVRDYIVHFRNDWFYKKIHPSFEKSDQKD
jgi:hypothetical protein